MLRLGADAQRLFALRGLVEHLQGRVERQFVGRHLVGQARPALALLEERPVAAHAHEDRLAARPGLPIEIRLTSRASISSTLFSSCCFKPGMAVAEVERLQVVDVAHLAAADRVELVFHLRP